MEVISAIALIACIAWPAQKNLACPCAGGQEAAMRSATPMIVDCSGCSEDALYGLTDLTPFLEPRLIETPDFGFTAEKPALISSFNKSYEVASNRDMLKLGFNVPPRLATGTFTFNFDAQGRLVPQYPWIFPSFQQGATIDQGSARMGIRWQDHRKDEINASLGSQFDSAQANHFVNDVDVALKTMLPEPFSPWYLQGEVRADTAHSEQAALTLGASGRLGNGSQLDTRFGIARRESRTRSQQKLGSNMLSWAIQWKVNQRLGIVVTLKHYLDTSHFDALISLEVKSP